MTDGARRRRPPAILWLVLVVAGLAGWAAAADARHLRALIGQTEWVKVWFALLFTVASYASISACLVSLGRAVGVKPPRLQAMGISLVSVTVNHLVSLGGVAGYSLRAAFSKRYGVTAGDSVAISLVHSYLNNVAMFALLGLGMLYLVRDPATDASWRWTLQVGGALLVLFLVVTTLAMFSARLRGALIRGIERMARRLMPSKWGQGVQGSLRDLDAALGRTAAALRERPRSAFWPLLFLVTDWGAVLGALWFSLDAVGEPVGLPIIIAALSVGVVAGFASLLPGGIGVQDGSLAAVLALQGVPLDRAVLGTLLFRIVYYVVPFLTTLPVYASFLRRRDVRAAIEG